MEPWRVALDGGDAESAWDLFIDRYRRLIIATIRRTLDEHDDVADVFAQVCQALSGDDLRLLRRFTERGDSGAKFSTWLVVVVRNQTIDWIRRRSGRPRVTAPESLSPIQREIFQHVFADRRSHAEAYELMEGGAAAGMSYRLFLRELALTYRLVDSTGPRGVLRYLQPPPRLEPEAELHAQDALQVSEARARLEEVLESLPDDTRLAVHLFVVDELPAERVARTVGWPGAKDVYNRVYRALDKLRRALERQGIRRGDL
ncbi:MAG TPA: sigma-70 family RNA polymerase sigma factor [Gemmatimonadaceae bacterium]|nr:sigma-70 family RNA polymerase sigma factor [Gemmatimonadaceae bacterium]